MLTLAQEYGAPYNMPEPKSASFRASIKAQQYASGGVDNASKGWIVVLFLVFIMNIIVLVYFICHNGIVTDFSEPPTLFALAVNSPPSHVLAGSCGGGPRGKQYTVNWFVNQDGDHLFMEPKYGQDLDHEKHGHVHVHDNGHTYSHGNGHTHTHQSIPQNSPPLADTNNDPFEQPPPASPGRSSVFSGITERFKGRDHQSRPMSIARSPQSPTQSDMEGNTSRARKQYDKLASRRSVLF